MGLVLLPRVKVVADGEAFEARLLGGDGLLDDLTRRELLVAGVVADEQRARR